MSLCSSYQELNRRSSLCETKMKRNRAGAFCSFVRPWRAANALHVVSVTHSGARDEKVSCCMHVQYRNNVGPLLTTVFEGMAFFARVRERRVSSDRYTVIRYSRVSLEGIPDATRKRSPPPTNSNFLFF